MVAIPLVVPITLAAKVASRVSKLSKIFSISSKHKLQAASSQKLITLRCKQPQEVAITIYGRTA